MKKVHISRLQPRLCILASLLLFFFYLNSLVKFDFLQTHNAPVLVSFQSADAFLSQ